MPQFHLESSIRKWGGQQVEVLSAHCVKEEAHYLKYILAESSSQGLLTKGSFVPTGIHLMEGKEVLTQLLHEQQQFLDQVTSFQLGGVSYADMKVKGNTKESIQTILLQCDRVVAVEPTYQTVSRGLWLVVVQKKAVDRLAQYVARNINRIYRQREGKTTKIINVQTQSSQL